MNYDYTKSQKERVEAVREECSHRGKAPSTAQLTYMADYILGVSEDITKDERLEEYPIVSHNREVTLNKREVSYDEMADYGDDLLHDMISNDPVQIMDRKEPVDATKHDSIAANMGVIDNLKRQLGDASGKRRFELKKQIISKYRELYTVAGSDKIMPVKVRPGSDPAFLPDDDVWVDEDGMPHSDSPVSFLNKDSIVAILQHAAAHDDTEAMDSDTRLLAMEAERILKATFLPNYPVLYEIATLKAHNEPNENICCLLEREWGVRHSAQYISTTWRNRIPLMVVRRAQYEYILRHHDEMGYTHYLICPKCGMAKVAHPLFFCRNSTNSGYYSVCKSCRNKGGAE